MDLSDLVRCPLSGTMMHDPVHAPDGYLYERSHIVAWLQADPTSPLTGEFMDFQSLVPAKMVHLAIQQMRLDEAKRATEFMPYIQAVERPPSCAKAYVKPFKTTPRSMTVPKTVIALVIGTRGKTVRTIEEATDTNITIDQTNDPCIVTFGGQHANVLMARASVANIVDRVKNRSVDWRL